MAIVVPTKLPHLDDWPAASSANQLFRRNSVDTAWEFVDADTAAPPFALHDTHVDVNSIYPLFPAMLQSDRTQTLNIGAPLTVGSTSAVLDDASNFKVGVGMALPGAGVAGAELVVVITAADETTISWNTATSTEIADGSTIWHDATAVIQQIFDEAVLGVFYCFDLGSYMISDYIHVDTRGVRFMSKFPTVSKADLTTTRQPCFSSRVAGKTMLHIRGVGISFINFNFEGQAYGNGESHTPDMSTVGTEECLVKLGGTDTEDPTRTPQNCIAINSFFYACTFNNAPILIKLRVSSHSTFRYCQIAHYTQFGIDGYNERLNIDTTGRFEHCDIWCSGDTTAAQAAGPCMYIRSSDLQILAFNCNFMNASCSIMFDLQDLVTDSFLSGQQVVGCNFDGNQGGLGYLGDQTGHCIQLRNSISGIRPRSIGNNQFQNCTIGGAKYMYIGQNVEGTLFSGATGLLAAGHPDPLSGSMIDNHGEYNTFLNITRYDGGATLKKDGLVCHPTSVHTRYSNVMCRGINYAGGSSIGVVGAAELSGTNGVGHSVVVLSGATDVVGNTTGSN